MVLLGVSLRVEIILESDLLYHCVKRGNKCVQLLNLL